MNDRSPQSFRDHPIPGEAMMRFSHDSTDWKAEKHRLIMRAFDEWPADLGSQLLALKDLLQILDGIEEQSQQSAEPATGLPHLPPAA